MAQKKKKRKSKKQSGGFALFLLKAIVFAAAVAAVFWVVTKGLDKWDASRKNATVTPSVGATTPGATKTPDQDPTGEPGKKGEKTPTPAEGKKTPTPEPTETPIETPTPTEEPKELSNSRAVEKLKTLSAAKLKLSGSLSSYTYETDDWTSVIEGRECICVNVINAEGLREGVYYVAVDGSVIFREAEDNVFEKIAP